MRTIQALPEEKEILVIDDNSPDGTAELVSNYCKENSIVRLIIRKNERGLCTAVQRGIDEATGDIIVWMDCDLSMPPEKIPELVDKVINKGYDAAVGSRYVKGGKDRRTDSGKFILFFHKALSRIIVTFTSLFYINLLRTGQVDLSLLKAKLLKKFL